MSKQQEEAWEKLCSGQWHAGDVSNLLGEIERERDAALRGVAELREQLAVCEEHAGTMAKDFDGIVEAIKGQRDGYKAIADSVSNRIQFAIDAIGKEQLSDETGTIPLHRAILNIIRERDELRAKVEQLKTQLQTEGFRADGCQTGMDAARRERDELRKDLCEIAEGCGVGCPDISEAKRRIIAIRADRDEAQIERARYRADVERMNLALEEMRKEVAELRGQLAKGAGS